MSKKKKRAKILEKIWELIQKVVLGEAGRIGTPEICQEFCQEEMPPGEKVIATFSDGMVGTAEKAAAFFDDYSEIEGIGMVLSPVNLAELIKDLITSGFNPAVLLGIDGLLKIKGLGDLLDAKDNLKRLSDLLDEDDLEELGDLIDDDDDEPVEETGDMEDLEEYVDEKNRLRELTDSMEDDASRPTDDLIAIRRYWASTGMRATRIHDVSKSMSKHVHEMLTKKDGAAPDDEKERTDSAERIVQGTFMVLQGQGDSSRFDLSEEWWETFRDLLRGMGDDQLDEMLLADMKASIKSRTHLKKLRDQRAKRLEGEDQRTDPA